MTPRLKKPLAASVLARELGLALRGPDLAIHAVCPLDQATPQGLTFCRRRAELGGLASVALIASPDCVVGPATTLLASANPRLDFVRALDLLAREPGFREQTEPPQIHPSVKLGQQVVVGNGAVIGEGTVVYHHVVIAAGVRIGRHCLIKSGAIIGEEGFGFERLPDGRPLRMQQLGAVVIGDHVEVGSQTTICRGALIDTVVEDHVKIDDHVHIAHNCLIRSNVIITACAELSGGVHLEQGVWVAPNVSVLQKVHVGARAMLGIGAVVCRNVPAGVTVFGNPATPLPQTAP